MSDVSAHPSDPGPATPDTADWTWVLTRPCPDCGFDPDDVRPEGVTEILLDAKRRYAAVLARPDARTRPSAGVWSPLEYCAHVRDVCDVMRRRLEQILDGGGEQVRFADWDQDATAAEKAYWQSDPAQLRVELEAAFDAAAAAFDRPTRAQLSWPGLRSNGSRFTVESLGRYFVHDVVHHLWDVRG
ncbi:DinB family protein [Intrasporangium sp.]|uniref:DinB family protein n=1 Tax=Intrasporangium sp. TaxID=1925024 RepID=UPI0029397B8F|nr:DinB family protein [Intrasporangium sp.]MDV3221041.1 DinB family protein [Intrasporangium sp.]